MGNINVVTTNKAKVTTNKKPSGIIQGAFILDKRFKTKQIF